MASISLMQLILNGNGTDMFLQHLKLLEALDLSVLSTQRSLQHTGLFIYVPGSAIMSLFCVLMGTKGNIFLAYLSYILSSGINWWLACLVCARCGQLIADRHFIVQFSLNNVVGLLLQPLLQAVLEITRLSIFARYVSAAGFFLAGKSCINEGKDVLQYSEEEPAPLVTDRLSNGSRKVKMPAKSVVP